MAKQKPLQLDPERLLVLAKARDRQKAQLRALSGKHDDLREVLADVRRRASLTRENATYENGPNRHLSEEEAAKLEVRAAEIREDMRTLQAEIDLAASAAAEAGRVLAAALAFAKAQKLEIPRELQAEAADRAVMPMGAA